MTTALTLISSAFVAWILLVGLGFTRGTLAPERRLDFGWRRARIPIVGYAVSAAAMMWSLDPSEPVVFFVGLPVFGAIGVAAVALYHSLGKSRERRRQRSDAVHDAGRRV